MKGKLSIKNDQITKHCTSIDDDIHECVFYNLIVATVVFCSAIVRCSFNLLFTLCRNFTVALLRQPVQGGNVAPVFHPGTLCKSINMELRSSCLKSQTVAVIFLLRLVQWQRRKN